MANSFTPLFKNRRDSLIFPYSIGKQSTPVTSSLTTPVNVCVSLFDGLAFAFHSKLDSYGSEPKVLVFTSINPQLVRGEKSEYL
ncbi:hypothetical protein HID58_062123 [Brassica napus]|uniref:Uncharacterized protein n=1 Tax=Brassica napus TaxID=3708 RepID=A0ABQ8A142_BRANA|nr:hypothetical protein HID58_062123 [Brassica napus]